MNSPEFRVNSELTSPSVLLPFSLQKPRFNFQPPMKTSVLAKLSVGAALAAVLLVALADRSSAR